MLHEYVRLPAFAAAVLTLTRDDDQTQLLFEAALVRRARLLLRAALCSGATGALRRCPLLNGRFPPARVPPPHTSEGPLSARSHSVFKDQRVDGVVKMAIGEKCPDFARVGAFGLRSPHAEPKTGCPPFFTILFEIDPF